MDGIGSFVFLTDLDSAKDADVQVTLISRALEVASKVLADRSLPMPAHLRCVFGQFFRRDKHNSDVCFYGCVDWWLAAKHIDRFVVPRPR